MPSTSASPSPPGEETIDIISIAQQASPKVSGQRELPCAQRTACSASSA